MDRRKESLSDIKLCRFCLTQDSSLTSLYDRSRDPILVTLPLKIMACVSIEVFPSDKMPSYICERCRIFMDICYDFKQICRRADESCLQFVQNGIPVSAVPWPTSLTKIFNLTKKARPINTIVEGGATIQVTSQDMSENEEDEETYNIKIDTAGDSSKSGTACVKATGGKETPTQKKAGFSTVSKLTRHVRSHAGDRAYPCKYCSKSFMKSHHYTRHLRLKHEEQVRLTRGADAEFRCEQCGESFSTQDDLYYHSAIHATQNLICPLCQEKFENVDAVTTHIRTHVNGIEFMCEYCELVFTSKEKLDAHMAAAHEDELTPRQELGLDESSLEADAADADADVDADDDDEDNGLNVKEEDDHMVVEIKKADGYMLRKDIEVGQATYTNSEDSEMEAIYTELSTVDTLALARAGGSQAPVATKSEATSSKASRPQPVKASNRIGILRKAEAIKRNSTQNDTLEVPLKKERAAKVDSTTPTPTLTTHQLSSDKSLRLLEKELKELTKTPWRSDGKSMRFGEARRKQPVYTSTPKLSNFRSTDEKKASYTKVSAASEKKLAERRPPTKDKEPKEGKEARNAVTSSKEEKSVSSTKDDRPGAHDIGEGAASKDDKKSSSAKEDEGISEKQAKISSGQDNKNNAKYEKTTIRESRVKAASKEVASASGKADAPGPSAAREERRAADRDDKAGKDDPEALKNGDTGSSEENVVRRSTRPSKIKNYANMIRDRTRIIRDEHDDEENSDDDAELEKDADQLETSMSSPAAARRRSAPKRKPPPAAERRRGRPRKEPLTKDAPEEEHDDDIPAEKAASHSTPEETKDKVEEPAETKEAPAHSRNIATIATSPTTNVSQPPLTNMLVSPTGQTLKKVPIKSLPPGIKPLPLPINARSGDLCHMQIGKKMVKVQKIVMTKAEVEAMAKKGLLEMKDGTMVLKQGIKLPGTDPAAMRSGIVSPGAVRKVSATPMRCNFDGEES